MFLVQNRPVLNAAKVAIATLLFAVPNAALAKSKVEILRPITALKSDNLLQSGALSAASLAAPSKNAGKGLGQGGVISAGQAKNGKSSGGSSKAAKQLGGGKTSSKNDENTMVSVSGSGLPFKLYPLGQKVRLNAKLCFPKGDGSVTFQLMKGGRITFGSGCNKPISETPASGKKAPGAWAS